MSATTTIAAWALLPLAGGCGAWARFHTDKALQTRLRSGAEGAGDHPNRVQLRAALPIFCINVMGCFIAGLLYHPLSQYPRLWLVVATGFLGGWTTFSTAMMDIYALFSDRRWTHLVQAVLFAVLTLLLCVSAAWVGVHLA